MKREKIVFSGVQPSGSLHIGNYLGAIKQFVELQKNHEAIFCIVDLHAITVPQDPKELYENTLSVTALYLAAGIDPKKSIIFVQSHVSAHAELGWILNTMTPVGELERMTQFKDKARDQGKKEGVMAGLLNYPVLQAADILLYQTNLVPVGEDQRQHIELTRTLARRFNERFGKTFVVPEMYAPRNAARIMGLDDPAKKMSKSASSANNFIALLDPPDEIRRKIKIAVTDSGSEIKYDPSNKPALSNLITIYGSFNGLGIAGIEKQYRGRGYADFKNDLGELLVEKLEPLQKRYRVRRKDEKNLLKILGMGRESAEQIARKTLSNVRQQLGFVQK